MRALTASVGMMALLAGACRSLTAQGLAWSVDSASVTFEIRNAGLPVHGSFRGVEAAVCFDPDYPNAGSLIASVDPATIETGIALRDRHLQRREYFYVERYGRVELRSVRLWKADSGYAGTFLLRMRDVEREVEIPFAFETSRSVARISGSLMLDRLDYGIGKRSLILSDEVRVRVELTLTQIDGASSRFLCPSP